MELEFKTKDEIMEFFRSHNVYVCVNRICELLISHNNVQATKVECIKVYLHKLKVDGFLLIRNEGCDIYHEEFSSTPERVERYFRKDISHNVNDVTGLSEEQLLTIIRRNENSNIPGSLHQQATQELSLRDREKAKFQQIVDSKILWWEKSWIQIIMLISAIIGIISFILFFYEK